MHARRAAISSAALVLIAAAAAVADQEGGPGAGKPPRHEEDPYEKGAPVPSPPSPREPTPTPTRPGPAHAPPTAAAEGPARSAPKFVLFASASYALSTWVNTDYLLGEDDRSGSDIDWGANLTGRFLLGLLGGSERKSPFGLYLEVSPGYREWHLRRKDTVVVRAEFHSTDVRMGFLLFRGLLDFVTAKPVSFSAFLGLGGAAESYESDFHRESESPGTDHVHRKATRGAFLVEAGGDSRVRLGLLFADARLTIWYTPGTEVVLYGLAISLGVGLAL